MPCHATSRFVLDIFVNFRTAFRDESDVLTIDSKIIVRRCDCDARLRT